MGQRSSTASINNSPATDASSSATNSSNHRHRHRHRNVSQSNSNQSVANMSPRSRLRNEISRRGYSNNQDILFRLFQAQSSSQSPLSNRNQNSDLSSDEDESTWNHDLSSLANTLPFILGMRDLKCFVCNKMIPADDVEAHIMMCLTKPRLTYNEDVLTDDKGECIICLEELEKGQTIARLPCLCIYHKQMSDDLVAKWDVNLPDGKYRIEFEHGTTSGRRVIRVNNKEIMRQNWMFKLVGQENFSIGKNKFIISIDSASGFTYEYSLEVNGKSYEKFCENQSKILHSWTFIVGNKDYRLTLEKNTMDLWLNGERLDVEPEFIENGTETKFDIHGTECKVITVSSGHRRSGLVHALIVNDKEISPAAH